MDNTATRGYIGLDSETVDFLRPCEVARMYKKLGSEAAEATSGQSLKDAMLDALVDCAEHYAHKGYPPDEISRMLRIEVLAVDDREPFANDIELNRAAAKGYRRYINAWEQSHRVERQGSAYTKPNNIALELDNMEQWIDYRTEQFHFGIYELDKAIGGGAMKGQMMSIIGNPGSMKTSLLLSGIECWITEAEMEGRETSAAFFSLDMDKAAIFERLMLREMELGRPGLVEQYRNHTPQYAEAKARLGKRYSGKLTVMDSSKKRWDSDSLLEYVECNAPELVCIDYLTLLKKQGQSDYDVANEATLALKDISRRYGTCVVILSQMSMASRREQASGGMGGSARGGGIVNEISDIELELFRDVSGDPRDGLPRIIATITKARSGVAGSSWQLAYNGPQMRFGATAAQVSKASQRKPVFDTVEV